MCLLDFFHQMQDQSCVGVGTIVLDLWLADHIQFVDLLQAHLHPQCHMQLCVGGTLGWPQLNSAEPRLVS
jgi:hypothetical protein